MSNPPLSSEPVTTKTKDEARMEALEQSFIKLSAKAVTERKLRGNATMRCICKDAGVDITYAYGKKTNNPKIKNKYKVFQEKVNAFHESFLDNKNRLSSQVEEYNKERDDALEENFILNKEVIKLKLALRMDRETLAKKNDHITILAATANSVQDTSNVSSLGGNKNIVIIFVITFFINLFIL